MGAHVSLLAIAGLPLLAGLLICGCAPAWRRWFGDEGALAVAGRVALGATLLSGLLVAAAVYALRVRPDLSPTQLVPWAGAGRTTALDLDLELGGLALAVTVVALLVALAVQIAALGDPRDGARTLGRSALLLAGTGLLALSATVWGAALGWQLVALVTGWSRGHVAQDMSPGTGPEGQAGRGWGRLAQVGVWLAVLVTAVGAGDLGFAAIARGALLGEHASLLAMRLGGPFGGVAPASVAAVALVIAALAGVAGLPAALRGASTAARAAVLGLASGAGVLLLLRLHVLLTLAPVVMAGLALAGATIAALAGVAGLRARGTEALARVAQAYLGLLLLAVGVGAWAPACGLLLAYALTGAALGLEGGRWSRWLAALALAGVVPGALLWSGELLGAAFMYMSAGSPGLNVACAALAAVAALAIAGSMGHVLRDRSEGTGGELGLAAGLLALAAVLVAAIDVPGQIWALRVWIGPEFAASWLLPGEYALGPRPPYSLAMARLGAGAWFAIAALGVAVAPRLSAWASRLPLPRVTLPDLGRTGRALAAALHELGELQIFRPLLLGPTAVARAPGRADRQRGLVLALFGALAVLGVVYCNPDVSQLGPSRTYPVDVGGINPALLGTRRAGAAKPAEAAEKLSPETGAAPAAPGGGP